MEKITFNFDGNVRIRQMEGRDFLVAPMVMITEGVHTGSRGPIYYPGNELAKTPQVWNHKPVVVYHPVANGADVSACDPEVIENYKVGLIMNCRYEDGKLKADAWLEEDRLRKVDERVLDALQSGTPMEVSTGVFVDDDPTIGVWNNATTGVDEDYTIIARNLRADHLAILPDKVGACSLADGAGLLRNEAYTDAKRVAKELGVPVDALKAMLVNVRSFENIADDLRSWLHAQYTNTDAWLIDVYESFFIYSADDELWQQAYTASDTTVTVSDEPPTGVQRVTEYRTLDGAFVGNANQEIEEHTVPKTKLVDAIIANKASQFTAEDNALLMGMDEATLNKLTPVEAPAPEAPAATPDVAPIDNAATTPAAPVATPDVAPQTFDQFVANAPADFRDVLVEQRNSHAAEKQRLVSTITANERNTFTPVEMDAMSVNQLRQVAALAVPPTPAPVPGQQTAYVGNGGYQAPAVDPTVTPEEPLEVPTMNFGSSEA